MNKTALLLTALMSVAMVSEAAAWSRNRTVTTNQGSSSMSATGTCAGVMHPQRRAHRHARRRHEPLNGSVTCDPSYQNCTRTKTYSGSNGGSATVTGSVSR